MSIDEQTYLPFEHIVVNGSTTEEIKIWSTTNQQPNYRKFINERDNGISDAFNKGIAAAKGKVLLMLNAGDKLSNVDVIEKVAKKFAADDALMWLHGMYKYQRANIWVTLGKPFEASKIYRGMRSICHQTMFVKKSLHDKYGLYDVNLKISMDFDFLVRIRQEKFTFLPEILAIFAPGGTSMNNLNKTIVENTLVLKKYNLVDWRHILWTYRLKILIYLINYQIGKKLYSIKAKLKLANM